EDDARAVSGKAAAKHEQPADSRQVEEDRGGVGGGEVVPGPMPRQHELERNVCVVVERAVGVAEGVVGGEGMQYPYGPAVHDVIGADHARVADVDDTRVRDVESDPKAEQEGAANRK